MRFSTLLLTFALASIAAQPALAQTCTTEWAAPVNGDWNTASNWTNGVPQSGSVACITEPGTYTVSLTANTAVAGYVLGGESGTQTLTTRAEVTVSGDAHVRPNGRHHFLNRVPGGSDGLYLPNGTMLVEGEVVVPGGVSFLSTGGTLDVTPGGVLRLINDGSSGARLGDPSATFGIRGLLEADCASATCWINAPLDLDGGTVAVATGQLDVRGGGTLRDLTLETTEGATLLFNDVADAGIVGYVLEGTVSGIPAGNVYWSQTEVAAGPANATLDVGGTGFQLVGVGGSFLTSAGGEFVNTGLLIRPNSVSNFSGLDGVTVRNEGRLEVLNGLAMRNGAEIVNEVDGVIAFTGSGNLGGESEDASLVSRGLIVVEPSATGTSFIQVPVDLAETEIRVEAARLDIRRGGSLRDTELVVAEGATLNLLSSGDERLWTLDGTLSGEIDGSMSWYGSDFAAGPSNPTLDFTGEGLVFSGQFGYATAFTDGGGEVRNTGRIRLDGSSGWGIGSRGATLINEGRIELTFPFRFWEDGLLRNEPGGVVQMANGGFIDTDDAGIFENYGLILREGDTSNLGFDGTLRSQPGSEIRALTGRVDLDPPAEDTFPEGTTITGTSQVRLFGGDFIAAGTISPGTADEPLAALEFESSFKLGPTARLVMDVGEDGQSDRIVPASGQASTLLGGTLVVRLRPGYAPTPGDEFVIFLRSANPYNILGEFDAIEIEGEAPEGLSFAVDTSEPGAAVLRVVLSVAVSATVATTPEGQPAPFVLTHPAADEPFSIEFALGGTATRFADYTLSATGTTVRAQPNTTQTVVTLYPRRDADPDEGPETVTLDVLLSGGVAPAPDAGEAGIAITDGPSSDDLALDGVTPAEGENLGTVTASVFGTGFGESATVSLDGPVTIQGETIEVTAAGARATFDLAGAPAGTYDVVVESGGEAATLADGFTVTEGTPDSPVWASLSGTPSPRLGRWSTYTLTVGNDGATDLYDTLVLLRITNDLEYEITDAVPVPGAEEYSDLTGFAVENEVVVPLYLYALDAGSTKEIRVRVRPTAPIGIGDEIGVGYSLFPPNPEALFTYSGELDDFNADVAEGRSTNWAVLGQAVELIIDGEDPATAMRGASATAKRVDPTTAIRTASAARLGGGCPTAAAGGSAAPPPVDPNDTASNFNNQLSNILSGLVRGAVVVVATGVAVAAATAGAPVVAVAAGTVGLIALFTTPASASTCGTVGGSVDPNDKLGPGGWAEERFYRPTAGTPYTVRFENLDTATFPAQEVIIVDTLDTEAFDLSTFAFGPIRWGTDGEVVPPPGAQAFETEVSLSPEFDATLLITAALETETGRATWHFVTLDNGTGDLPEDGTVGFLPPNQTQPEGEGSVSFVVDAFPGLSTGTVVANQAEIVFDVNEPIVTPVWINTVDLDAPVSSVQPIEPSEGPVTIEVEGSDLGAGIQTYALYVAEADGPFELYAISREPTFEFEGEVGVLYGFYSIVTDFVQNTEGPKDEAEATLVYGIVANEGDSSLPREVTLGMPYPNPSRGSATLRWGLPEAGRVTVQVYDLLGREVARLADAETTRPGWHEKRWSSRLASGVYIVRLRAESRRQTTTKTQRLVIVR